MSRIIITEVGCFFCHRVCFFEGVPVSNQRFFCSSCGIRAPFEVLAGLSSAPLPCPGCGSFDDPCHCTGPHGGGTPPPAFLTRRTCLPTSPTKGKNAPSIIPLSKNAPYVGPVVIPTPGHSCAPAHTPALPLAARRTRNAR